MMSGKLVKLAAAMAVFGGALFLYGCFESPGEAPIAAFSYHPQNGEVPLMVHFDASLSQDPDGQIDEYNWDFGDGTTGTGVEVDHEYTQEGDYTVTLTVVDNHGLSSQTIALVKAGFSYPLDVLYWQKVDTYYGTEVRGRVKNIGNRPIAQGRIAVRFYEPSGTFLKEDSAYVYDFPPGAEQDFTVPISLSPDQIGKILIHTEVVYKNPS
jgi:hypothetical protein